MCKRYNEARVIIGSDIAIRLHLAKRNRQVRQDGKRNRHSHREEK